MTDASCIVLDFSVYSFYDKQFGQINKIKKGQEHVVIPLLLHRYQYCICKSSMLNTTCASITLHSLCLVLVLLFKYSYGAIAYMALKLERPDMHTLSDC